MANMEPQQMGLALVIKTLDSAIQQTHHDLADKYKKKQLLYPLEIDSSSG